MSDQRDLPDDDFDEKDFEIDEFEGENKPHPLVTAGIFLGLVVLAAIICAILWSFTHRDNEDRQPVNATETMESVMEESEVPGTETEEIAESESVEPESTEDVSAQTQSAESDYVEQAVVEDMGEESTDVESVQEPISGNESMTFTEIADTVTAKDVTNLRSAPSTVDAENVVAQLLNGETLARTGVNDSTGWSRLDYNGQTVYAVSGYLTTDLSYETPVAVGNPNRIATQDGRVIIFQDCDDYVTPKEYVNLRTEPSTSQGEATAKCQISNGTEVHRTGHSPDSGWSRVEYNGEVLYVVSSMVMNTYEAGQ